MRLSQTSLSLSVFASVLIFCALGPVSASAQAAGQSESGQRPTVVFPSERVPVPAAHASEVECGGAIEQAPAASPFEIVGAEDERQRTNFAQGDMLFVGAGSQQGVREGQEFLVVRPRGQFRTRLTRKSGPLGVYTQEVGRVRVVRVRDGVSVAEVVRSCDDILLGDLLRPVPQRAVPAARPEAVLDRFAEPSGKQTGRIVLARDGRESLSRDQVVFVDLGAEDNLKVGDYLTVYRPEGQGFEVRLGDELGANTRGGFESRGYRGGKFSNQSKRVKDVTGTQSGSTVKTPELQRRRAAVPRHVVGELVILRVEGRTATAVVTRVAEEMHTGDHVEVQ